MEEELAGRSRPEKERKKEKESGRVSHRDLSVISPRPPARSMTLGGVRRILLHYATPSHRCVNFRRFVSIRATFALLLRLCLSDYESMSWVTVGRN